MAVEVSEIYADVETARRHARGKSLDGKPEDVLALPRLRHMLSLTLDMIFTRETDLLALLRTRGVPLPNDLEFDVSSEDFCRDETSVTMSRRKGQTNLLMPDPFFFNSQGYDIYKRRVLTAGRWRDRSDLAVWRGSTTGQPFDAATLASNERVALAAHCAKRPDLFDVKITAVVQAADPEIVSRRLQLEGLLGDWKATSDFINHKFALHIDGNASAAGFFEKLSLGCCVLRVESRFEQWFEERLEAWTHYVPVQVGLDDLVAKVEFLLANPDLAEKIAMAGFRIALDASYHAEAGRFIKGLCTTFVASSGPVVLRLGAPLAVEGQQHVWHEIETVDAVRFRWTKADRIAWPRPKWYDAQEILRIELALVHEITPGFAALCSLTIGQTRLATEVHGRAVVAHVPAGGWNAELPLLLLTPPPLAPSTLTDRISDDHRLLGLAIRVDG